MVSLTKPVTCCERDCRHRPGYRWMTPAHGTKLVPAKVLGDSHISLQPRFELPATVDGIKLLHATPEGNGPWGLIIAVPTTEAGDDPACPGEASDGVRVFLPFCLAFECRTKCFEGFDLRLGEYSGRRQLVLAVTFLHQLQVDTGGFGRRGGQLDQAVGRGELAVLQLQPLGFHHAEQLFNGPASLVPGDNLPSRSRISDLMRGQQPPVQRLHSLGWFALPHLDQP